MHDNEPCCVCGKMTNSLAGDPGKWPYRFGHVGGAGKSFVHCGACCTQMYEEYMIGREPASTVDAAAQSTGSTNGGEAKP